MHMIRLLGMLAGAAAAALAASPATADTDVKFALDWKFEGPAAPYFVAIDKGYYKAEGLNVTIDSGPGSVAGIARVAAGTYRSDSSTSTRWSNSRTRTRTRRSRPC